MSADGPEPLVPKLLPEQRVGAAMREARESAGTSLRSMAGRLGYHSHTTLSSYERGAVMPTDEAVAGYERLLGLAPGALVSVLEDARIERHGDAWAKRRVHLPVEFVSPEPGQSGSRQDAPPRRPWLNRRWVLLAGGILLLALAVSVAALLINQGRQQASSSSFPPVGVRDGSDPRVTGCATGAVILNSVDVFDPPEHLAGVLQLRSSARCGTNWGRFIPTSALSIKPTLTLVITVYRPADGASAKFRVTYDSLPAFGNMLISSHECVYAQLTLMPKGQASLPPIQTACRQSPSS